MIRMDAVNYSPGLRRGWSLNMLSSAQPTFKLCVGFKGGN